MVMVSPYYIYNITAGTGCNIGRAEVGKEVALVKGKVLALIPYSSVIYPVQRSCLSVVACGILPLCGFIGILTFETL